MSDKPDPTIMGIAFTICGSIITLAVLGCLTYSCTQPPDPKTVDQEAQATRMVEVSKMTACVRAGGSWMPVTDGLHSQYRGSDYYTSSMSCVTDKTLSLATTMNTRK